MRAKDAFRVAIDGPAASGKSTTARAVAERIGALHLNSGLLYRAITWAALEENWLDARDFDDRVEALEIELLPRDGEFAVRVDGEEPGAALTSAETASRVSEVAARPGVRRKVLRLLRAAGRERSVVCDGRDIGTEVFPDAELKIFLVADAEERARRRLRDHGVRPTAGRVREETRRLRARDRTDSERRHSPLRKSRDAVEIDTTDLAPEEVVERIVALAGERLRSG